MQLGPIVTVVDVIQALRHLHHVDLPVLERLAVGAIDSWATGLLQGEAPPPVRIPRHFPWPRHLVHFVCSPSCSHTAPIPSANSHMLSRTHARRERTPRRTPALTCSFIPPFVTARCLHLRLPSPNFRPCTLASLGLSPAAACASFRSATPSASPPGFSRSSSASARSSCTSSCRPTSRTHARS